MSWLGESFTNLKGQISNFTKEVLAETPEEGEEFAEADGLRLAKARIAELEAFCTRQQQEIEHLQVLSKGKAEALDTQNKSLVDSYQKLIQTKDEENQQLHGRIEQLIQESEAKRDAEAREVQESENAAALQPQPAPLSPPVPSSSFTESETGRGTTSTTSVACQTEITESSNVTTETDTDLQGMSLAEDTSGGASNGVDDSYLRELEERCSEYQTDLYSLRAELMTLQADVDQSEEAKAKLSEDILNLLHSTFIMDGQPALGKLKHSGGYESSIESEQVILSALRQLASIWKGLLDKKSTLERTVAKLSTQSKCKTTEDQVDLGINLSHVGGGGNGDGVTSSNIVTSTSAGGGGMTSAIDFFPPKVDSFGLETIIEEERAEEDSRSTEADRDAEARLEEPLSIIDDQSTCSTDTPIRTAAVTPTTLNLATTGSPSPSPTIRQTSSSFTQTENEEDREKVVTQTEPNSNEEELRAQIFASLEGTWLGKENDWIRKVEEKEARIQKLQADLERLQNHLVDLEEQYTNEALVGEEREKQLRLQIAELQREISQTMQSNDKSGGIRDEVVRLTAERDFARSSNASLEEQLGKLGNQLQNLHFVLEQFQKEKELEIIEVRRGIEREMKTLETSNQQLRKELGIEKDLLVKARSGLEAAQQLNLQIEDKTRLITQLRNQIQEKESQVERLSKQLEEINNNNVAKIDRYLVKNLIVGYFTTPADKRTEVLRVIATVLDFNREDRQKTGLESTSMWPFGKSGGGAGDPSTDSARQQSFTSAFIRFLESESQPKTQIKIPLDEMTRRNSKSSPSGSSTPVLGASGGDGHTRHSSTSSSVGMSEMSVNLPVLNQADRSNSILKDVLNPRS